MPRIVIRAEGDEANGIVEPFRHDYAVSTDSAFAEPDEAVVLLQQGPSANGAVLGNTPRIA
jgi:hypothetical protein